MMDWLDVLNPREWATVTWIAIALFAGIRFAGFGSGMIRIVKALFQPKLLAVFGTATAYIALCVWGLSELGWWNVANLKSTIIWAVTFAFVTMVAIEKRSKEPHFYRRTLFDTVSVTALLTFVIEFYSFSYPVELLLLPSLSAISLIHEFAKKEERTQPVARLFGGILSVVGFAYLGLAFYKTFLAPEVFFTADTARELAVPAILSALFLPFLYAVSVYMVYDRVFTALVNALPDEKLRRYAKRKAIRAFGKDVESVDRWRHALFIDSPDDRDGVARAINQVRDMKRREASPPPVPTDEGWSPQLAIKFLSAHGLSAPRYSPIGGDEWHGSSPMVELGKPETLWRNNLAYYVGGSIDAATQLTLKLNLNAPDEADEAEKKFREAALTLTGAALGPGTVERLESDIIAFSPLAKTLPNGEISLVKGDGITPVRGSYSRILQLKRDHEQPK